MAHLYRFGGGRSRGYSGVHISSVSSVVDEHITEVEFTAAVEEADRSEGMGGRSRHHMLEPHVAAWA